MEELIARQLATGNSIQQVISNFKKDPAERKKSQTYFEKRKKVLNDEWALFESTHMEIEALPDRQRDHDYFQKDYFDNIAGLVQQYQQIFQSALSSAANEEKAAETAFQSPGIVRRHKATADALWRHLQSLDRDIGEQPVQFYKVNLAILDQLWNDVANQHYAIVEEYADLNVIGYDLDSFIELESRVQQQRIKLSMQQCGDTNAQTPPAASEKPAIRLPKITIPMFNGSYLKWRQFADLFIQMIDIQQIPAIQKMWYLKGNISGEAERLIRHLTPTEENYSTAWRLLQDRYENKRVLTSALIANILDQPSIPSDNAATAIRSLHDVTHESLLALNNLGIDTAAWSPLLLHLLVKKLDKRSHLEYEQSLDNPRQNQTVESFLNFLERRFQSLDAVSHKQGPTRMNALTSITKSAEEKCKLCGMPAHPLFACKHFIRLNSSERMKVVLQQKLCVNCLKPNHKATSCNSRNCLRCNKRHNSLLHPEGGQAAKVAASPSENTVGVKSSSHTVNVNQEASTFSSATSKAYEQGRHYVVLATAKVKIIANNHRVIECRALLDSGSQVNLVTERLVNKLNISTTHADLCIEGVGKSKTSARKRINVEIHSNNSSFGCRLEAFVLANIIAVQPSQYFDTSSWKIPDNITLADPNFNQPEKIDVLLGAEFFHQLITPGQMRLGENLPTLQNTVFGWVFSGKIQKEGENSAACGVLLNESRMEELIERFWKIDGFEERANGLSTADELCVAHFAEKTTRTPEGRFVVRLPFADSPSTLGESRQMALNRLIAIERRLAKNDIVRNQYREFMETYEALGHMTKVEPDLLEAEHYFIPHHYVLKPDSSTTQLRVVFDASAKTSSGKALNDILHTGPVVQPDLFTILLRFRQYIFVFTTDIEKMYRQVRMHPLDRPFQMIVWRANPTDPPVYYQLNTVTYGTKPAQFLATNVMKQLAIENKTRKPLAASTIEDNFYVDNGLGGSNSLRVAIEAQEQLDEILGSAGLPLRKWCANHPRLLSSIPAEHQEVNLDFDSAHAEVISTLGLIWSPKTDSFCVKAKQNIIEQATKRSVNSELARIFDPLGILAPVVITAKIFVQQLWQYKMAWDDPLPDELQHYWNKFCSELPALQDISFPRHVFAKQEPKDIQIHAFADASEKAYGAAVYVRSVTKEERIIVRLLCAKSRVAPLQKQTVPRLELCAAVLAAQLTSRVKRDLRYENKPTYLWTDSQIVLHWINLSSSAFHTFVANRVAKIQELSLAGQWRHVGSRDNPADCLSRGIAPKQLATWNIWFYGPTFLHGKEEIWPRPFSKELMIQEIDNTEIRKAPQKAAVAPAVGDEGSDIYKINHHNSFQTLQRIVAYMRRFINHTRHLPPPGHLVLSPKQLDDALIIIVRCVQQADFIDDINQMTKHEEVSKTSSLKALAPFLGEHQVIRVGGRLEAAALSYDAKHPMLLSYNDPITKLIMQSIHVQNRHCGPQTLQAITRQKFWPLRGKTMARSIVQHCVTCRKANPKFYQQLMGQLPSARVQPARPFVSCGVDFCGPFWIHYKIRGKRPHKAYVAVFCCFAVKAVHFELVTDLTTNAFIGALKRFIARRGHCENIFCDNATNFVGANNQLSELQDAIHSGSAKEAIIDACSIKRIKFNFIPPRAPHFGGLWEAAVKSAKHLLVRST